MKSIAISKWWSISLLVFIILICYMPWAYYPDIEESFSGFYTKNNIYGKPGKYILVIAVLLILFAFSKKNIIKQLSVLLFGLLLAYIVKVYIQFLSCYNGYCPDISIGLYLLLPVSVISFFLLIAKK